MIQFANRLAIKFLRKKPVLTGLLTLVIGICMAQHSCGNLVLTSIQKGLLTKSQEFLGADIEIRSTSPLNPSVVTTLKENALPHGSVVSQSVDCVSILTSSQNRSSYLVQVKAVHANYPLYGQLSTNTSRHVNELQSHPYVWIDPSLKLALGLHLNSDLKIGNQHFVVAGILNKSKNFAIGNYSHGPRVIVGWPHFVQSGIVGEGSQIDYVLGIKLANPKQAAQIAKTIRQQLNISEKSDFSIGPLQQIQTIQVITSAEKTTQWVNIFQSINYYFALISTIVIILGSLTIGGVLKGYIQQLLPELGTLHAIGVNRKYITIILGFMLIHLMVIGVGIGTVLGSFGYYLVHINMAKETVVSTGVGWAVYSLFKSNSESVCLLFVFGMLPILHTYFWSTVTLINAGKGANKIPGRYQLLAIVVAFFLANAILFFQTNNMAISTMGTLIMGMLVAVVYGAALIILRGIPLLTTELAFVWQFGLNNLYRYRQYGVIAITSLSIGIACLTLVSMSHAALLSELNIEKNANFPELFLVGVPDRQKEDMGQFFKQWNCTFQAEALIKAQLTHINGYDVKELPVAMSKNAYLINREQNLSYRDRLTEDESLYKGEWMKGYFQTEASLEYAYAKQLGINLGDSLTFDIQGVPIIAKVTSFRHVRWTSFRPNFLILITPSTLQAAPKEWIGTVSGLSAENVIKIQAQLTEQFPGVTTIPIKDAVQSARAILTHLFAVLKLISLITWITGLTSLISIVILTASHRQDDIQLLKIIGFRYSPILKAIFIEFLTLTAMAVLLGLTLALGIGSVALYWMDLPFTFPIMQLIGIIMGLLIVSTSLALGLARTLYNRK